MSTRQIGAAVAGAVIVLASLIRAQQPVVPTQPAADGPRTFKPTMKLAATTLAGWHTFGAARWNAQSGEYVGVADANGRGGWLVLDQPLQDVQFYTAFRCSDPCNGGVMIRASKLPAGGLKGTFVSLSSSDLGTYTLTVDANGTEVARERLAVPQGRGRGPASGGEALPPGRGRGSPQASPPAATGRGRGGAPPALVPNGWNTVELLAAFNPQAPEGERIVTDTAPPHLFKASLNGASLGNTTIDSDGFGATALYVGGGEVRYKNVALKDLGLLDTPKETVSPYFTMQRVSDFYYGWSAAVGDYNHDGLLDVTAGPFFYRAPDFTERRRFRVGRVFNPSSEYAPDMVNMSWDVNGDGWWDVISSELQGTRPLNLHLNPKGEARIWDRYRIVNDVSTELVLLKDLNADGRAEIIFGGNGIYQYAQYDPADVTKLWALHAIGTPEQRPTNHGIGVGDMNGDQRLDVVVPSGWFEQRTPGISGPWVFHPANFGGGGGEMGIYDVNGDGLTDVVTGLAAHGFGLSWFEQRRNPSGERTFVEHRVMGDYSEPAAGGVTFSELHASTWADMDGDRIPDFIVGKRRWGHLEGYNDPDDYGPAVLYVYRTVRNPKAPGGAELVPELVHNHSGVGSHFQVADINKDGAMDIVTSTGYGTHIFFGKPAMQKKWNASGTGTRRTR